MTEAGTSRPAGKVPRAIWLRSDERLSTRARKGDRGAFEAIYRRYHQDLYRFCLSLVGNPEDAEEALQNTMVKVLGALPGDQRVIQLRPWLYRIARNESIETLRKRREGVQIEADLLPSGRETAETAEAREHLRRLIADLSTLPEKQRAALVMRELGGLGFAEIGDALETSEATSRQTVYEARLSLRQMEAGREMKCEEVTLALSEADGRVTRRRDIQAHLRACHGCQAFRNGITKRRGELGALAPLPAVASAGLLQSILSVGHSAAGGSMAGATGVAAGKVAATSAVAKTAATVAVVAAVGVTAADRGGLIDVPIAGNDGATPGASPRPGAPSPAAAAPAAKEEKQRDEEKPIGREGIVRRVHPPGSTTDVARPDTTPDGDSAGPGSEPAPGPGETGQGKAKGKGSSGGKASKGRGRQDGLPAAAAHGQQTAAAHKSPSANPTPGTPPARGGTKAPAKPQTRSVTEQPIPEPASPPPPTAEGPREGGNSSPGVEGDEPVGP